MHGRGLVCAGAPSPQVFALIGGDLVQQRDGRCCAASSLILSTSDSCWSIQQSWCQPCLWTRIHPHAPGLLHCWRMAACMGATNWRTHRGCRPWPVREYAWGKCEPLAPGHSDVVALNRLLFELCVEPLKAATEQRYLALRGRRLHAQHQREQDKVRVPALSQELSLI